MKKFFIISIVIIIATAFFAVSPAQGLSGAGTEADPYLVTSCADLADVNDDLTAYYRVTADMDCSADGNSVAIGNSENHFEGVFDGDSHSITIALGGEDNDFGLFRYASGAEIFDVTINGTIEAISSLGGLAGYISTSQVRNVTSNVDVEGYGGSLGSLVGRAEETSFENVIATGDVVENTGSSVGGAIGYGGTITVINSHATGDVSYSGSSSGFGGFIGTASCTTTLTNVYATGNVTTPNSEGVGGLVGNAGCEGTGAIIEDAYATGNVIGLSGVGGLVGSASVSEIDRAFAEGNVTGNYNVGGLVGVIAYTDINNVYSRGVVTGNDDEESDVGGLAGELYEVNLTKSYSTGEIISQDPEYAGGLVGYVAGDGSVLDSFWDLDTSSTSISAGGTGKTTSEMKDFQTYSDVVNTVGLDNDWNFEDVWAFVSDVNDDYPCLIDVTPGCVPGNSETPEGPNDGDGNNDGTPDDEQENVDWVLNPVTNEFVVVEVDESCNLSEIAVNSSEDNAVKDPAFTYPTGFVNFSADCGEEGFTTQVRLFFYNLENKSYVPRKYNPTTGAYYTIENAELVQTAIGDDLVIIATYSVTDGGVGDSDGVVNGVIVDPAALGVAVVGAPRTGGGGTAG